jgi:hypothetical protein
MAMALAQDPAMAVVVALAVREASAATMGFMGKATALPAITLKVVGAVTTQVDGLYLGWDHVDAAVAAVAAVLAAVAGAVLPIHGRPAWAAAAVDVQYLAG